MLEPMFVDPGRPPLERDVKSMPALELTKWRLLLNKFLSATDDFALHVDLFSFLS